MVIPNILPLRIIISGTRVHGIAQLCSPRRPCHRLGGLQPGTALQTASKNSNVRPFHSSKGVFTAPPSEPSIAACPCPCSSPPWRCKLLCGCQRLLLSTACYGTVCHDGSAGCGNAEARHIHRPRCSAAALALRCSSSSLIVSVAAEMVMPACGCASRCGHERWYLSAGHPWVTAVCVEAREAAACGTLSKHLTNNYSQRE